MRSILNDSRAEVLRLTATRPRTSEEFLKRLNEAIKREPADTKSDSKSREFSSTWTGDDATSKRLTLARNLLDDDQVDLALQIAAPALDKVNQKSIDFLSALRAKRPQAADEAFVFLMTRADGDPASDANTVSHLSCYVFTPGSYITFSADGDVSWGQGTFTDPPPDLPPGLRNQFFHVALTFCPALPPQSDTTGAQWKVHRSSDLYRCSLAML